MPKISVIMPVYNAQEYLNKSVESVLSQTFTDFELILVNDGSGDNSPNLCDEWAKKDNRIKVIHQKNSGVTKALKAGIKIAESDYISFIDSDDWIEVDFLKTLLNAMLDYKADIVQVSYQAVLNDKIIKYKNPFIDFNKQDVKEKLLEKIALNESVQVSNNRWTKMYKKEVVEYGIECCPVNQIVGEDLLMNMAAYTRCERIVLLDIEPLYNYRMNIGSTTNRYNYNVAQQEHQFWQTVLNIANASGIKKTVELDEILQENYVNHIFNCFIASNLNLKEKIKEIKNLTNMLLNKSKLLEVAKKSSIYKKIVLYCAFLNLIIIPLLGIEFIRKVRLIAKR